MACENKHFFLSFFSTYSHVRNAFPGGFFWTWNKVDDFRNEFYALFRIPESRSTSLRPFQFDGMQLKPSLVSIVIFLEVDSLGRTITKDSR